MSKADKTAERKLSAAEKQKILRLYDAPYTTVQIARELNIPVAMVRRVLQQTNAWMTD